MARKSRPLRKSVAATPRSRELRKAFNSANPGAALRDEAVRNLAEVGRSREELLGDFEDLRAGLGSKARNEIEETILEVMDQVVGFCHPDLSLERLGRSEDDDELDGAEGDDEDEDLDADATP